MDQQTFLRSLKETNLDLLERADQGDQDALDEINRLFQEQTPEPEPVAPEPVTPEPVAPEPLSLLESIRITDKQGRESYSSAAMLQNNVDPRETVMRFLENAPDKTLYESSMKADNVYSKGTGFLGMGRTEMKHRDFISEILKRPTADPERKAMLAAIEAQVEETESQEDIVSQDNTRMEDRQAGVRGTRAQAAMPDFEAVDAYMDETWGWLPETNEEFQDYEKHLKANDPVLKAQLDRLDRGGRANLLIQTREEDLEWQKKFQALAERGQSPSVDPGVYVWAHKRGLLDAEPVDIGKEISKLAKSIGRGSVGLLEGAIDAAAVSVAGLGMEFFGRHFVSREFYEDYMEGVSMSDEAASAESTGAVFSNYLDVLQGDLKLMGDGLKRLGYKTRKNRWEDSQLTDEERDQAFSEYLEDKRQFELSAMDNMVRYNRIVREVAADTGVAEQEVYDQLVAAGIVLDPTNLIPGKVLMAPVAAAGKGVAKLKGAVSPTASLRASLRNQMRLHADYLAKTSAARTAAQRAAQSPQNKVYARNAKNLQKQADKTGRLYQKAVDSSQKAENAVRKAANKNRAALTAGDRARNVARGDQAVADALVDIRQEIAGKIGSPGIRRTAFGEAASGAGKLGQGLGVAGQKAGEVVGSNPATFVGGLGGVTLGAAQTFGEGDDSWVEAGGKIIGGGVAGYYGTKATAKILSVGGEKFSAAGMNLRHFGGAIRRGQSHMPLHQVLMNHAYGQTHLSPGMKNLLERYDRVYMHPLSAVSAGALAGAGVGYAAGEVYDFFSEGDDSTPGALIGGSALLGGVRPRTALGLAKIPFKVAESLTSRAGVADIGFEAAQGYVEGGGDMDSALMGAAFGGVIHGAIAGGQSFVGPIGQVFGFEEGRNIDAILSTQVRLLEEIHQGRGRDIEGWFDNEVLTSTGQVRIGGQEMNFGEWFNTLNAAEKKLVARQTMIHPDVELRVFNDPNQDYPAFYSPEDETVFLNIAHSNWNTPQPGTQVSVALANTILGHEIAHYVGHHEGMDSEVIRNYFGNPALGHSPANSPFIRYEHGQPVIRDRDGNTVTMTEALAPDADGNARSDLHYELSDLGKARIYDYVSRMDFNFLRGFLVDENNQPVNASAANVLSQEFQSRLYAQDADGNATDPDAQTEFIDVLSQQPQMLRYIARELFAEQTAAWMTGSEVFEMKSGLSLFEDNFRNLIGGLAGRVGDGFFKERGEVRSSIFSQLTQFSGVQKLLKDYNNDVARGRRRETEDGDVIDITVTEDDYANNPQALELFDASGSLEWEPVQAPSDPPATPPQAPAPEGPTPAPEGPTPPQAPAPEGPTSPTQVPPRQPKKDPKTGKPKIKTPKQQKKDAADLADAVLEWLANNPSTDPNTARPQEKGTVAGRYLPPELLDYLENTGQFNPQQIANLRYVNELLREGGEAIRTFYQAATGINSNGKRSYKALSGKWRTVIPHGIEITKGGNVIVRVIDPSQLHANAVELASRPEFEALWGNNLGQMQADMMTWLNNMADATRSGADGGLGERKRNFFRVASGLGLLKPLEGDGNQLLTGDQLVQYERDADRQRAARDMEILAKPKGKRQAYIKSFRLDRMNQVRPAPGEGLENPHGHDAYRKALANLHTGVEYDEQNPAPYKIDYLGFYSPSERAAYERLPEEGKIHASRAWRILMNQKGVAEEAVWTGLKDFILWGGDGNKSKSIPRKSITRQEILDFVEKKRIELYEEDFKTPDFGELRDTVKEIISENGEWLVNEIEVYYVTGDEDTVFRNRDEAEAHLDDQIEEGTAAPMADVLEKTAYEVDTPVDNELILDWDEAIGRLDELIEEEVSYYSTTVLLEIAQENGEYVENLAKHEDYMKSPGGYDYYESILLLDETVSDFEGSHYNTPGEVANIIGKTRHGYGNKKFLYIEETQSDANKAAREQGVKSPDADDNYHKARAEWDEHIKKRDERLRELAAPDVARINFETQAYINKVYEGEDLNSSSPSGLGDSPPPPPVDFQMVDLKVGDQDFKGIKDLDEAIEKLPELEASDRQVSNAEDTDAFSDFLSSMTYSLNGGRRPPPKRFNDEKGGSVWHVSGLTEGQSLTLQEAINEFFDAQDDADYSSKYSWEEKSSSEEGRRNIVFKYEPGEQASDNVLEVTFNKKDLVDDTIPVIQGDTAKVRYVEDDGVEYPVSDGSSYFEVEWTREGETRYEKFSTRNTQKEIAYKMAILSASGKAANSVQQNANANKRQRMAKARQKAEIQVAQEMGERPEKPAYPSGILDAPYLLDQKWMPLILKRTLYRAAQEGMDGVSWSLAKDIHQRYNFTKGKDWPRKVYEEAINNTYRSILRDLGIKGEPDTVTLADGTVARAKDKDLLGKTGIHQKSQNDELYAYVPITEELRHKVRTQGMPQFHTGVIDFDINNPANKDAQRSPANWSSRVAVAVYGKEAVSDDIWPAVRYDNYAEDNPVTEAGSELKALVDLAREEDRVLSTDDWNERVKTLEKIGSGYESTVYRDGDRVLKSVEILPGGLTRLNKASVGKFLRRQALFNEVFGGDVMFEGVVEVTPKPAEATYVNPFGKKVMPFRPPTQYRVLLSQKFHANLEKGNYFDIQEYFKSEGFEKAPDSMGFDFIKQTEDGKYIHARDAHEENFMSTQPLSLERWKSREMEQYKTLFGKDWNADFFEQSADWDSAYQDYVRDFKRELVPLDIVTWMNESGERYNPGVDDAAYLAAAESGDMETAQALVDKAAKAAGYTVGPVFHGTSHDFTKFDVLFGGWFATDILDAEEHAAKSEGGSGRKPRIVSAYLRPGRTLVIPDSIDMSGEISARDALEIVNEENGTTFTIEQLGVPNENLIANAYEFFGTGGDRFIDNARDAGFDLFSAWDMGEQHYSALNPQNIKSADPITRDDDGNVIPLSQRFDVRQDDIRYNPGLELDVVNSPLMKDENSPTGKRNKNLTIAARKLARGEITAEEYADVIDQEKPVTPYNFVPKPATVEEMTTALGKKAVKIGKGAEIEEGTVVGIRLDIDAYTKHDTWVGTVHLKNKPVAHESVAHLTGDVQFPRKPKQAQSVAQGYTKETVTAFNKTLTAEEKKAGKGLRQGQKAPFAQIIGEWKPTSPEDAVALAEEALNSPEWTQVGYDPTRHTYYYDRANHRSALISADEVIQIGPLVLAKNAKTETLAEAVEKGARYNPGVVTVAPGGLLLHKPNKATQEEIIKVRDQVVADHPEMKPLADDALHVSLVNQRLMTPELVEKVGEASIPFELTLKEPQRAVEGDKESWYAEVNEQAELDQYVSELLGTNPDPDRVYHVSLANKTGNPRQSVAYPKQYHPGVELTQDAPMLARDILDNPEMRKVVSGKAATAALLRQKFEEQFGQVVKAEDMDAGDIEWLGQQLVHEAVEAFSKSGNAVDWYTKAVERTLDLAEERFPELAGRGIEYHQFLGAVAMTSQNMRVYDNLKAALHQYEYKKKHGRFDYSTKHGEKGEAITGNLKLFDTLENKLGEEGLMKFVKQDFTVRELTEYLSKLLKREVKIAGYTTDAVKGSAAFGPKIGQGFFQNLLGNYDPVTVDLWLRRTFGRLTGDVVRPEITPGHVGRVINALRKNKGKAKLEGLDMPEFLKGIRTKGDYDAKGHSRHYISQADFDRLFDPMTEEGAANLKTIEQIGDVMKKEWESRYSAPRKRSAKEASQLKKDLRDLRSELKVVERKLTKARETVKTKNTKLKKTTGDKAKKDLEADIKALKADAKKLSDQRTSLNDRIKRRDKVLGSKLAQLKERQKTDTATVAAEKPEWAFIGSTLADLKNPVDSPSDRERAVIAQAFESARKKLKADHDIDITNADLQALLWYPEKDIWAHLQGKESNLNEDYSSAMEKLLNEERKN